MRVRGFGYYYHLRVTPRYCGASYTLSKPLPGEDWLRGGDLHDGRLWALPAVLWDVVSHAFGFGRHRQHRGKEGGR